MLQHPDLAHAMITSTQAVRARSGSLVGNEMRDLILATAGADHPTAEQCRVARLVEQVTFGILTWTVGAELDSVQAVDDVRLACRLLLADILLNRGRPQALHVEHVSMIGTNRAARAHSPATTNGCGSDSRHRWSLRSPA